MNDKGFTLVEVLVTLAIMGIITGIAFPSIMRARTANEEKKYEMYEQSMITAARLYADKYKKDLTGGKNYCIYYNTLISTNYLKPYENQGSSVKTGTNTYVIFTKGTDNRVSGYEVSLMLSNGYDSKEKNPLTKACDIWK